MKLQTCTQHLREGELDLIRMNYREYLGAQRGS